MSVRVGTTVVSPLRSGGGGTSDYTQLTNKPKINNVELNGNKTSSDLGLQPAGNYALKSEIPTVPTNVSAFTNDAGYLTTHQDISGKEDRTNKVTSISSSSTNEEYPSAKCVYDAVQLEAKSAYDIAVENGYSGTEEQWVASLHASQPTVLALSAYPTEASAIEYMGAQVDHSKIYVWNNKLYCYSSHVESVTEGACLYGYRPSGSTGLTVNSGKSTFIIPVSSFTAPLVIDYTGYELSSTTPYFYGSTSPTTIEATIKTSGMTAPVTTVTAQEVGDNTYIFFAIATATMPSNPVNITVNDTPMILNVITSTSEIESAIGTSTITVNGYTNSGVDYMAIMDESSTDKYLYDRITYLPSVPDSYCQTCSTDYTASTRLLNLYDYTTMQGKFSSLATNHPEYVTETLLGRDSSDGYNIYSYVLDAPDIVSSPYSSVITNNKPTVIITSGLHGLEHDAFHTVYHMMDDLCNHYMENECLMYLRSNIRFVIMPICNPWGYSQSYNGINPQYHNSNDVDLNKNFECGYRNNGSANTGTAPYSESEALLMKTVFDDNSNALLHVECHGKASPDNNWGDVLWFSLMSSLASELIEVVSTDTAYSTGKRLKEMNYNTGDVPTGHITYYTPNGRPKDYTGTKYGMLSLTIEGTGRLAVAEENTYSVNAQKINCETIENFVLKILKALNGAKLNPNKMPYTIINGDEVSY